ncbi:unannotated protein [freshwater metagenome]|uniref:Unannotated protein n=1 Tax=freshwater metagenome TaxID=449393 RepID=A0A6J6JIS5_9ZZZZ
MSGLLTKPAVTVWSNREPRVPFVSLDVSEEAERVTERRLVDPNLSGAGVVIGATVVPGREGDLTTVALVQVDEVRTVVQSHDHAVGQTFMDSDPVGLSVIIGDPGEFTLA